MSKPYGCRLPSTRDRYARESRPFCFGQEGDPAFEFGGTRQTAIEYCEELVVVLGFVEFFWMTCDPLGCFQVNLDVGAQIFRPLWLWRVSR